MKNRRVNYVAKGDGEGGARGEVKARSAGVDPRFAAQVQRDLRFCVLRVGLIGNKCDWLDCFFFCFRSEDPFKRAVSQIKRVFAPCVGALMVLS